MMVECWIFEPEISFQPEISVEPHQMSACVRLIKVRQTYSQSDIFYLPTYYAHLRFNARHCNGQHVSHRALRLPLTNVLRTPG